MDKEFLHKVLDQIMSETTVYYDMGSDMVQAPFVSVWFLLSYLHHKNHSFYKHCQDVYGLTKDEIDWVWGKYKIRVHATSFDRKFYGD